MDLGSATYLATMGKLLNHSVAQFPHCMKYEMKLLSVLMCFKIAMEEELVQP